MSACVKTSNLCRVTFAPKDALALTSLTWYRRHQGVVLSLGPDDAFWRGSVAGPTWDPMDPIDFLRRQGSSLAVEARGFQPKRRVSVTVRVCLIIQWGRASLGYMEERRWEVTGLIGGFLF